MSRPLSTLNEQMVMEEHKSRKRIQNRMAQRLYRQRQRQRIEESKAKLAAQHEKFPECANSIPMVWCRSRSSSSASRQNVCAGGLAEVRRDPFFAVSDEQCTRCTDSPMFSGPEDPGNEDIGELLMLQYHSPDLSSSFAPIAVMSVAGPEVWACDTISDLNIIDPEVLFDFHFNHGMGPVPRPPMNTPDCGNTVVDSPSGPRADQYELPACPNQSKTFNSHSVSNSGVDMLKDLFTTTTEAQRHSCTVQGCTAQTVASIDNQQRDDGTQTNEPWLSTKSPGAEILDALLSSGLTDIPLPEVVERQPNCGRRLPRVIASVRCALQEWRNWEQDGFPLG